MTFHTRTENLLEQCAVLAKNSKCSRRKFGAIITSFDGVILSTGWNGSVRGSLNCGEDVGCIKDFFNVPSYQGYEMCPAVHAEENAIINAAREGIKVKGGIMYLNASEKGVAGMSCPRCRRAIINAGIEIIFYKNKMGDTLSARLSSMTKEEDLWMREQEDVGMNQKDGLQ